MKTRNFFEPSDFGGSGQLITRMSAPVATKDIPFLASVSYKIGWDTEGFAYLVSLTDGMCVKFRNKEEQRGTKRNCAKASMMAPTATDPCSVMKSSRLRNASGTASISKRTPNLLNS